MMPRPVASASVWKALADDTRREILDLLRERPRTTGEVAAHFPSSRFAVMKHLAVLVQSGLVVVRRSGRERWNYLNAVPLQRLYERWVRRYEAHWAQRLLTLEATVEHDTEPGADAMATSEKAVMVPGECGVAQVELDIDINALPARVWSTMVDETSKWWRKDFYTLPEPSGFTMEPRIGGRVFEHSRDGSGVLWYTVLAMQPGRSLDLVGHITAAFGGPCMTMVRVTLEQKGTGTMLHLTDALMGRIGDEFAGQTREGWRLLFAEGLKRYVEE